MRLGVARRLSGAVGSLIVWAVHFVAVYGLVGIGCDRGWNAAPLAGTNALTFWLIAVTVPALALIAWFGWTGWRSMRAARAERAADASPESRAGVASIAAATGGGATAKRTRFLGALTLALAGIAFVSTIMTALPIFMLPPCQ